MAVVGEAHILVRAVTTQVKKDIQSGLKGLKGQGTDSGEEFGKGFGQGLSNQMGQAQKGFSSLMRRGYLLQSALGAVAGSAGALVGGLASLAGAAVVAGSSVTVLLNGMVALKVATTVGGMALKGVSQAVSAAGSSAGGAGDSVEDLKDKLEKLRLEARKAGIGQKQAALDFEKAKMSFERTADLPAGDLRRRQAAIDLEEAKLNLDNAKQANKDAKEALKEGPKSEAGADPYAGLTKTQKEFAQYLVTIQSKMVLLREAAASSFLPELQSQLQSFIANGYMGTLVKSFTYLSEGLAKFTADFSRSFIDTDNMRLLAEVFRNVTTSLAGFGTVAGNALKGFLFYLKNTNPLLDRFVVFLQQKTGQFAADQENNASAIQAFFRKAGDLAADFGTIFGNLSQRFKEFLGNTTGPGSGGQIMVDWLKDITGNFRNFDRDVENAISRKYFADTSENLKIMLNSFSGLFKFLLKLGGNPAVGQFWENLQAGQGALKQLVTNSAEAGPGLANILVNITKILAALSDSAQVIAFFDTLNVVFTSIASMLKDMKPLLDAFGPLIGTLSAIGLIFLGFKKAGLIIGGLVLLALKPLVATLMLVNPAARKAGTGMIIFSAQTQTALRAASIAITQVPVVGWIIGIVTALAAAGTALSMWSANTADQTAKATVAVAKSEAGIGKIWETAQKGSWNSAGDAFYDSWSVGIKGTQEKLDELKFNQDIGGFSLLNPFGASAADSAGQFERLGMGISAIAEKDGLPAASNALRDWADSQELSSTQSLTAYKEMDSLREQVQGYAEDLGVNVVGLDDAASAQLEYNFLMEDSGLKAEAARIKQEAFNSSIRDAIRGFIDTKSPLQQNERNVIAWAKATAKYNDIAGDSWKDYMKEFNETGFSTGYYNSAIKNQLRAATDYAKNLGKAQSLLSEAAFTALVAQGVNGKDLAAAIGTLDKGSQGLKDIEASLLVDTSGAAPDQIASMYDPNAVAAAIRKKYGNQGFAETIIRDMFNKKITTIDAMEDLGIGITNLIATAAAEKPTELTAKWGDDVADNLRKELVTGLNGNPIELSAKKDGGSMKNGGKLFDSNRTWTTGFGGYKNGGLLRLAPGGPVPGVGGPRADNIPAMLSVDEFVVNAAAARRNERLLTAINSGNASDLLADAMSASSGGTGTNIQINVHAVPNESVNELVSEVERRLGFNYRKGVSV